MGSARARAPRQQRNTRADARGRRSAAARGARTLPLFAELLVAGHTDPDAGRCEVTRALVAVRKLTGKVAPNSKFPDPEEPNVLRVLDEAQRIFEEEKDRLQPVVVI